MINLRKLREVAAPSPRCPIESGEFVCGNCGARLAHSSLTIAEHLGLYGYSGGEAPLGCERKHIYFECRVHGQERAA